MKKYRLLVTCIIAMGIIIIGTSNPVSNFYKTTNLISSGNITNEKADKDENSNKNNKDKNMLNIKVLRVLGVLLILFDYTGDTLNFYN